MIDDATAPVTELKGSRSFESAIITVFVPNHVHRDPLSLWPRSGSLVHSMTDPRFGQWIRHGKTQVNTDELKQYH